MNKYNEGDIVYIVREDRMNSRFVVIEAKIKFVTAIRYGKDKYSYSFIDKFHPESIRYLRRMESQVFSNKEDAEDYKNYLSEKRELNRKYKNDKIELMKKYNILEG